jgi:hypothetical protein
MAKRFANVSVIGVNVDIYERIMELFEKSLGPFYSSSFYVAKKEN